MTRRDSVNAVLGILCVFLAIGCGDKESGPAMGAEGGPCYPNGTCNDPLVCLSDLCVDRGPCTNGAQRPCTCANNDPGMQTCDANGEWGDCICAAECGDGTINGSEDCDGSDLNNATCETLGYTAGSLSCTGGCTFDTSACGAPFSCGNGTVESPEECDGTNLNGQTCQTQGFVGGALSCTSTCRFDTGGCLSCGNGIMDGAEDCDGNDFGTQTCTTATGYHDGTLQCTADCHLDVSRCHTCGNAFIEGPEPCDGANLAGATCFSETGFSEGTVTCAADCLSLDTSGCHECGNGTAEGPEACDITDFAGATCESMTGHIDGFLFCPADCAAINTSYCHTCGNNTAEGSEVCDGADLDSESCITRIGLMDGQLACNPNCLAFDISDCHTCSNGVIEGPELCDGSVFGTENCMTQAGHPHGDLLCTGNCLVISAANCHTCGNGIIEGSEECDTTNLNGENCISLGYDGGNLDCIPAGAGNQCTYDVSNCSGCTADFNLGVLQEGQPGMVDGNMNSSGDDHTLSCNPTATDPDQVVRFTINMDGHVTVDYVFNSVMFFTFYFGLYNPGPTCTTNPLDCQYVANITTGTLDLGVLQAGTYYLIVEEAWFIAPSTYTLTFWLAGGEVCDNNIDDDNDGLTDCNDTASCCSDPVCVAHAACAGRDGTPCVDDGDCLGGNCLDEATTGFPGGMCASDCSINPCDGGFMCVNFTLAMQSVCMLRCPGGLSSECRPGYLCYDVGGEMGCVPDCTDNSQCPGVGTCDVPSGRCGSSTGLSSDGQACTGYAECAGAVCFTAAPSGYCSSICSLSNPVCPGDGVCVDYFDTAADDGVCFDGCIGMGDCRGAYTCGPNPHNPPPNDLVCYW